MTALNANTAAKPVVASMVMDGIFLDDQAAAYLAPVDDFTVYWESANYDKLCSRAPLTELKSGQSKVFGTFEEGVELHSPRSISPLHGRSCICSCYNGKFRSGTFRTKSKVSEEWIESHAGWYDWQAAEATADFAINNWFHTQFIGQRLRLLNQELPKGLVVVSGATKCGKSYIARGLALAVMQNAVAKLWKSAAKESLTRRLPHLVSFEDPIEDWVLCDEKGRRFKTGPFAKGANDQWLDPRPWLNAGICFTPRKKNLDVESVSQLLLDARRQTPTCVLIGEVRSAKEWKEIVDFSGTGHLVIVTTHASSLSETISRILNATDAATSQARRNLAANLTGCVHLVMEPVEFLPPRGDKPAVTKHVVFPMIWEGTAEARNSLTGEGMSSVVPNGGYVLGRRQYVDGLRNSSAVGRDFNAHLSRFSANIRAEIGEAFDADQAIQRLLSSATQVDLMDIGGA